MEQTQETAQSNQYILLEEILNSVTHGAGALVSIAGLALLIVFSSMYGQTSHIVSCTIFGITLVLSDDSGGLSRIEVLQKFPASMLRIPYGAVENVPSKTFMELLQPWYHSGRSLIVDCVLNTDAVAQLWAMEIAYLQGDALAASGPRLDYEFIEYGV